MGREIFENTPQPEPFDPRGFRYTSCQFPPYRHLPGVTPHPRRDPHGHQYGKAEVSPKPINASDWGNSPDYLYGVDLYNFAYYWEAHEAWEGLWKTTQRNDIPGMYLQGLIQISAAMIKRELQVRGGMKGLARAGLSKLQQVAALYPHYCDLDLEDFMARMQKIFDATTLCSWPADPRIQLREKGLEPKAGE